MRPSENGNVILETKEDYDILGPALALAGYREHYVDDFGAWQRIDFSRFGLEECFDGAPRFSPLDHENPEVELTQELSRAVIYALIKYGRHDELVMDLGLDADEFIPDPPPPF